MSTIAAGLFTYTEPNLMIPCVPTTTNLCVCLSLLKSCHTRVWQIDGDAALIYPEGASSGDEIFALASALFFVASILSYAGARNDNNIEHFQLQEWWWAAKDGYLGTMVHHFIQNGGL